MTTTEPRPHRAQLHLCHERIAAGSAVQGGAVKGRSAFCDLSAWAWCYDCDFYVCDIHAFARHEGHDYAIEFPDRAPRPGSRMFRRPSRR
jgi:hypothetical protein